MHRKTDLVDRIVCILERVLAVTPHRRWSAGQWSVDLVLRMMPMSRDGVNSSLVLSRSRLFLRSLCPLLVSMV